MRAHLLTVLLVGNFVVACGQNTAAPPVAAQALSAPPPALAPPELKLPEVARPLRNDVDLVIDPTIESFTGRIKTELEIKKATSVLWLNGLEIEVQQAILIIDGHQLVATASSPKKH